VSGIYAGDKQSACEQSLMLGLRTERKIQGGRPAWAVVIWEGTIGHARDDVSPK
jgi:hypothetical protein